MAKKTFEQAMTGLETIIEDLESSDLPLKQILKEYKQGVELLQFCENELSEAERSVCELQVIQDGAIEKLDIQGEKNKNDK